MELREISLLVFEKTAMAQSRGRKSADATRWALLRQCLLSMVDLVSRLLRDFREWLMDAAEDDEFFDAAGGELVESVPRVDAVRVKREVSRANNDTERFYAVARGFRPGIYRTWRETAEQVHGYSRPLYQRFNNEREAEQFMNGNYDPVVENTEGI
jgi:hypothetical protein